MGRRGVPGKDDDEAHNNCRSLPAYRQILTKYPAELWHRRWRRTYPHTEGLWCVEFELEPKTVVVPPPRANPPRPVPAPAVQLRF